MKQLNRWGHHLQKQYAVTTISAWSPFPIADTDDNSIKYVPARSEPWTKPILVFSCLVSIWMLLQSEEFGMADVPIILLNFIPHTVFETINLWNKPHQE